MIPGGKCTGDCKVPADLPTGEIVVDDIYGVSIWLTYSQVSRAISIIYNFPIKCYNQLRKKNQCPIVVEDIIMRDKPSGGPTCCCYCVDKPKGHNWPF